MTPADPLARRPLGRTDLVSSGVVLGTMTFGSQADAAEAGRMVDACMQAGVTFFDTANAYNAGASEVILGKLLADRREEVLIATKVFNPMGDDPHDRGLSAPAIRRALEASLRRLQTENVDVYYLHAPDWSVPIEESLGALDDLVRAGMVRHAGVSNYAAWQITEMHGLAAARGWDPVRISQPQYNLLSRRVEDEYEACTLHLGVANIVYSPLAGGLLTGKHRFESTPDPGSRFSTQLYRDRYWHAEQFAAVAELTRVAEESGLSLAEMALRWLIARPLVDGIILGASSLEQLRSNLDAVAGPALDADVVARCDAITDRLTGVAPRYNR